MKSKSTYLFSIDSPTQKIITDRKIELRGWLIAEGDATVKSVRVRSADSFTEVKYGLLRPDVARALSHLDKKAAEHSGFEAEFEYVGAPTVLQVDTGHGFENVHVFDFTLSDSFGTYNPYLASNYADHIDLLETKKNYYFEGGNSLNKAPAVNPNRRVVAIYLPQFHPIPQNDVAWNPGFTEWHNVAAAQPRFIGHRQPILPRDLGYYDLRLADSLKAQIDMAKAHGIYGLSLYYYWFSGQKILDTPVKHIMEHPEWDINFMICWANENWTKRWDGRDKEVIIEQKYKKTDPLDFIKDVEPILLDKRYIRVDNKPVLGVYRCEHLKEARRYAKVWREYFRKKHGLDLQLVSVLSFVDEDPRKYGFDAGLKFSPSNILRDEDLQMRRKVDVHTKLLDMSFSGTVFDYRRAVHEMIHRRVPEQPFESPIYKCVMPGWDNDARKKGNDSYVFFNESPDIYGAWLENALNNQTKEAPLTFVNAWNEWAEGTVLEPTMHYGRSILNATSRAMYGQPSSTSSALRVIFQVTDRGRTQFIVQEALSLANAGVEVQVLYSGDDDFSKLEELLKNKKRITIKKVPTRGEDILPYLMTLREDSRTAVFKVFLAGRKDEANYRKLKVVLLKGDAVQVSAIEADLVIASSLKQIVQSSEARQARDDFYSSSAPHLLSSNSRYTFDTNVFFASNKLVKALSDLHFLPEDFAIAKKTDKDYMSQAFPYIVVDVIHDMSLVVGRKSTFGSKVKQGKSRSTK